MIQHDFLGVPPQRGRGVALYASIPRKEQRGDFRFNRSRKGMSAQRG